MIVPAIIFPTPYILIFMFTVYKLDGENMAIMPRISIVRFPVVTQDNADFGVGFRHILKMSASNSLCCINSFNYQRADDKIFVCKFSKNVKSKVCLFPFFRNQNLEGKQ